MKRALAALTVLSALACATSAGAMTRDEALFWGTAVARNDCDDARGEVWLCADVIGIPFPKSRTVERCSWSSGRWCVQVTYVQWDFTVPRTGNCVTDTHWAVQGNELTYHSTGCSGINPALP